LSTVEEYIAGINDPKLRVLIKKLRSVLVKSLPQAIESLKWDMPNYSIDGENIAGIGEHSKHVNLYFFSGAKLSSKLLEGTGKGMRHVKIETLSDINEKELSRLLKQAAKLTERKMQVS
jgi:hypothetical protein